VALLTGVRTNDDSNADFPDGSRFGNAGAFLLNRFAAGERWAFELGGRVNRNWSDSLLRTGIFNGHEFYDKNDSVSGGAGATFQAHETVQLTAGAWSGFRPPNLSETVALRTGAANGADVPVAGLRPERTYGFEAGVRHRAKRVRQTLSLYHVLIRDGIERVAGTYLGRNFIDTNGNGTKQANEPLVFQKKNVSAGYVQGFEWKGEADLTDAYTLFGAASHAYGRDSDARVALSRMPPLMGLAGLRWTGAGAKKPWAEFYSRMAARQRRLAPSDLTDATIDPNGSPGWTTFNLRAGLRPLENLRATATLENITDKGYREHASGIDAPGFDAGLRLELFF
jgi:hemoglobin/transferrin/lactoferrin receptor protein